MDDNWDLSSRSNAAARARRAEAILENLLVGAGWRVRRGDEGAIRPDLLIDRQGASYAVEIKASAEGRGDRLIPLWSQAYLQAARAADRRRRPMAVVAAPRISPRVADQVLAFAESHAPNAAVGVIDFVGLRKFRGHHLDDLDFDVPSPRSGMQSIPKDAPDLFSDLNQWMLKVLLAPELPPHLLSAPRQRLRNPSQLARVAKVSNVSAYRFVQQLRRDGYLHESAPNLHLVRREDLFDEWRAAAGVRRVREVPMRFILRGNPSNDLRRLLRRNDVCLALFAAAESLKVGFVHGVPPHVYLQKLDSASIASWKNLVPAEPHEEPDLILRQAPAPHSVFRGSVQVDEIRVSDVVQVWLDVSSHPSRGKEQANLIRRRILEPVISVKPSRG